MTKRSDEAQETYLWVADCACFADDEPNEKPWCVKVITRDWEGRHVRFQSLSQAHEFIAFAKVEGEFPF